MTDTSAARSAVRIRAATAGDRNAIVRLVRSSGINPFSLHWPRFLVAEEEGRIVGVAQIKPHGDGTRELASLAVVPDRQGAGVGSALVREWLSREEGDLYLTCRARLEGYYARFGFRPVDLTSPYAGPYLQLLGDLPEGATIAHAPAFAAL